MSKIRIVNGPLRGREKTLTDKALSIGRDAEAGMQVLDRSTSRFHCELFPVGGMWFVRDLESKNGTFVNDERLKDEELLRVGDVIKIGGTEIIYEGGTALSDDDSSNRISYNDDPDLLSNTLEFRVDELSDLSEPQETHAPRDMAKGMRILYQVGRVLSEPGELLEQEARVLDTLIAGMPAECALVFRRDVHTGKLTPAVVRTAAPHIQPIISRSIIKKTFSENKALHSANAAEDDRFAKHASISLKGIRSVVCVPLAIGGKVQGVVYLSRGSAAQSAAFDQLDLELVSACAVQLGLAHAAAEERHRHRLALDQLISAMIRALEGRANCVGVGERCARTVAVVAKAMHLDKSSVERLRQAAMLHHFGKLTSDGARGTNRSLVLLESIDGLEAVMPLVRLARERVDGTGPQGLKGDDLDTEARILAIAVSFTEKTGPGIDAKGIIDALIADTGLDRNLTQLLAGCHADGSLYQE